MSCCTAGHLGSGVRAAGLEPVLTLPGFDSQRVDKYVQVIYSKIALFKPVFVGQGNQGSAEYSIQRRLATCSRGGG